ncbi:hypothetical protein BC938DRAFT_470949 [Jimgerdemannia flammicorona]|uniref:PHD-type domain-containing protein n=1 Tax=Jimgerdemannia flammicorona TaxID=994334 RepID=A0A433Q933_9FUNG|nr:hypothetical protein BC938DRAFT_470949 [Jimgerdemannia flammicorona]
MSDPFCFALLKVATLQISHAAGFEAANTSPANLLTDVFARYLSLLASTAKQFSELSGRETTNAWDLAHGLLELGVDVDKLRDWVEQGDARALQPTWNERTDPSLVLRDVLSTGKPVRDPEDELVYTYRDVPSEFLHHFEKSAEDDAYTYVESEPESGRASVEGEKETTMDIDGQLHDNSVAGTVESIKVNGNQHRHSSPVSSPMSNPKPSLRSFVQDEGKASVHSHREVHQSNNLPPYVPEHLPPFPTENEVVEAEQSNVTPAGPPATLPSLEPPPLSPSITQSKPKKKVVTQNLFKHIVPYNESSLAQGNRDELLVADIASKAKAKRKLLEVISSEGRSHSTANDFVFERALASVSEEASSSADFKRRRFYAPPIVLGSVSASDASRNIAAPPDTLFTGTFTHMGMVDATVRQVTSAKLLSRLGAPNLAIEEPAPATSAPIVPPPPEPTAAPSNTKALVVNGISVSSAMANAPVTSSQLKKSSLAPISLAKASASSSLGLALSSKGKTTSPPPPKAAKLKKPALSINLDQINADRSRDFGTATENGSPLKSGMVTPSSATSLPTPRIRLTVKTPDFLAAPSPLPAPTSSSSRKISTEEKKHPKKKAVPPPPPPPSKSKPKHKPEPEPEPAPAAQTDNADSEIINCVCDQPDIDDGLFMIACDKCSAWFHGRCVNMSQETFNEKEPWFCPRCRS